jgi:LuxR family transcriptional activator of conjugal transfer of Ti plasmids
VTSHNDDNASVISRGEIMDTGFQRFMNELAACPDLPAVEKLLQQTLNSYGFHTFSYLAFRPCTDAVNAIALGTYPSAWVQRYCDNRYYQCDPIVARSVVTTLPFNWSIHEARGTLTKRQRRFFGEADEYGIRHGFTIPIHDRRNKAATLTLATADGRWQFDARVERFQHELHLIALYLHARIQRSLLSGEEGECPTLTEREIACIQWVAWGKSATDIAEILRIRPRTVVFHVENAKRKFGVATLHQAVVKAVTHDLICA